MLPDIRWKTKKSRAETQKSRGMYSRDFFFSYPSSA